LSTFNIATKKHDGAQKYLKFAFNQKKLFEKRGADENETFLLRWHSY